jgi:hypothetical protein
MVISVHQYIGQTRNLLTANKSFENVAKFECLGTTVTNLNCVQDEMRNILNSGNACYPSV